MSTEQDEDVVKKFASILKTVSPKKKSAIYSTENVKQNNKSLSAIMSNISSTIKTLQKADEVRIKRHYKTNINNYKNSHFVPVQSLNYNSVIPSKPKPSKFETQCFSGTQLLNVVETAEAIFDSEDEISKEFKVPFNITTITDDNINEKQEKNQNNDKEIDLPRFKDKSNIIEDDGAKSPILNVNSVCLSNKSNGEKIKNKENVENMPLNINFISIDKVRSLHVQVPKSSSLKLNCKASTNQFKDNVKDFPRAISPILNSSFSNSIVFDLKTFEEFENSHIQSLIIENRDSQSSPSTHFSSLDLIEPKNILSQHDNKETRTLNDTFYNKEVIQSSPTMQKSIVEDLHKNREEILFNDDNTIINKSNKLILKDELLFSSDEEDHVNNETFKSLPSTDSLQLSTSNNNYKFNHSKILISSSNNKLARNNSISQVKYCFENDSKTIDLTNEENNMHDKILTQCENVKSECGTSKSPNQYPIRNKLVSSPILKKSCVIKDHNLSNPFKDNELTNEIKTKNDENHARKRLIPTEDNCKHAFDELENNESLGNFKNIDLNNIFNYSGFSTASNKTIKISEEALQRAKHIFSDINNHKEGSLEYLDSLSQSKYPGFKTASNKNIVISHDALRKTMKIFTDMDNSNACFESNIINNNKSKEATVKAKYIFDDFEKDKKQNYSKDVKCTKQDTNFLGFKTSNDKTIVISEEAILKTKHIFDDISFTNNNLASDEKTPTNDIEKKKQFLGFTTANNKIVNISEVALAKTKKLFSDITLSENKKIVKLPKTNINTHENTKNNIVEDTLAEANSSFNKTIFTKTDIDNKKSFLGFTTASNKTVKISEDAIAKTKNIFGDINFTQSNSLLISSEHNLSHVSEVELQKNKPFMGFTTASHKKVDISEDSLYKTKRLFDDIKFTQSDVIKLPMKDNNQQEHKLPYIGYTTANDIKLHIPEDALHKTQKMFSDINFTQSDIVFPDNKHDVDSKIRSNIVIKSPNNWNNINRHKVPCVGFTTASNKKVDITEEALDKTKCLFDDIKFTQSDIILPTTNHSADTKIERIVTNLNLSNESFNIDKLLNTQVVKNFEEAVYTEDFCDNLLSNTSKRSGSPILQSSLKRKKINDNPAQISKTSNITALKLYVFDSNYKKNKCIFLKDMIINPCIEKKDIFLNKYNVDNILNIQFEGPRNDINEDKIVIEELIDIFNKSVDKNIIPKGWIKIQLTLILWKLISYERKFGQTMSLICNAREVLHQLKYRYDRELNNMERPALRKIYERDDLASKSLVLCVVKIVQEHNDDEALGSNGNCTTLELTDGWYFIRTIIDKFLMKMVLDGKITVGTKLITIGAELLNCDQGMEPWEDTSKVRLKIFGNSTRRVRWHTRLGYHGNSAILTPLSTVSVLGGKVSKLRVYVTRVYPMLFIEKFDDGSTVTRSQRQEEIHQTKFEQERQIELEKIMEEVENETEDLSQDSKEEYRSSGTKRKSYESGSQIAKVMKSCKDVQEFCATLTSTQLNLLTEFNNRKQEEKISKLQEKVREKIKNKCTNLNRNVIALLKVRIADFSKQNGSVSTAILSIWKANESFLDIIKENSWIDIFDVAPTAYRNNELHLSAGLRSIITTTTDIHKKSKMAEHTDKIKRTCTSINELLKYINTNNQEIDTVGLIFLIEPRNTEFNKQTNQNQNFQNLYLTDENKNFICINFWGGLKKHGFENILEEGNFIAGINLQKRLGNTRKTIPQFRVTEFSYFTKTPKYNDARNLIDILNKKIKSTNIKTFCADCVELKNKKDKLNSYISPYRIIDRSEYNLSKHKQFLESPLINKPTSNLTPNQMFKKQIIKEKMSKLEKYGEPPPLCPLNIINTSTKIFDEYKSPLLKNTVARIENIQPNNVSPKIEKSSPVLDKTVIKRSYGNPVRLDFKEENDSLDHFAEEFDCSPPLSFDSNS